MSAIEKNNFQINKRYDNDNEEHEITLFLNKKQVKDIANEGKRNIILLLNQEDVDIIKDYVNKLKFINIIYEGHGFDGYFEHNFRLIGIDFHQTGYFEMFKNTLTKLIPVDFYW